MNFVPGFSLFVSRDCFCATVFEKRETRNEKPKPDQDEGRRGDRKLIDTRSRGEEKWQESKEQFAGFAAAKE